MPAPAQGRRQDRPGQQHQRRVKAGIAQLPIQQAQQGIDRPGLGHDLRIGQIGAPGQPRPKFAQAGPGGRLIGAGGI